MPRMFRLENGLLVLRATRVVICGNDILYASQRVLCLFEAGEETHLYDREA